MEPPLSVRGQESSASPRAGGEVEATDLLGTSMVLGASTSLGTSGRSSARLGQSLSLSSTDRCLTESEFIEALIRLADKKFVGSITVSKRVLMFFERYILPKACN